MFNIITNYVARNTGSNYDNELLEMNVYDTGLDSLLLVGLLVELEAHSGKMLSEEQLSRIVTEEFTFGELINAFRT